MHIRQHSGFNRNRQRGAALYVSLIMLILLALIGVVAMQVASLQERMSANFQASSMAFQGAEANVRAQETSLKDQVLNGVNPATNVPPTDCITQHDAQAWNDPDNPYVRRLDMCFSWGGLDVPTDETERTDNIYQITAYSRDRDVLPSSEAVVDTVFIP